MAAEAAEAAAEAEAADTEATDTEEAAMEAIEAAEAEHPIGPEAGTDGPMDIYTPPITFVTQISRIVDILSYDIAFHYNINTCFFIYYWFINDS